MISFNVFCLINLLKAIEDHSASFVMQDALQWHFRLLLSKPRLYKHDILQQNPLSHLAQSEISLMICRESRSGNCSELQ